MVAPSPQSPVKKNCVTIKNGIVELKQRPMSLQKFVNSAEEYGISGAGQQPNLRN
jgi:hypothetical protein